MVTLKSQHSRKKPVPQASRDLRPEPHKISSSTPATFAGKKWTPYGGLFPVATMLETLGFPKLVEEIVRVSRIPRAMTIYQFVLGMVLALYVGFSRLNHIRFVAQDPMLTGILKVSELPWQSTFWRFLASLNLNVGQQLLQLQRVLRERVWQAANVRLSSITLDTDTPPCTRCMANRWAPARATTRRTKARRVINPFSPLWPRPESTSGASCATATGRMASRSRVIWQGSSPPCPSAFRRSSRGPIAVVIAGRPYRHTKKARRTS